jgi:hypothetical protein
MSIDNKPVEKKVERRASAIVRDDEPILVKKTSVATAHRNFFQNRAKSLTNLKQEGLNLYLILVTF